jgi:hypothetical protein
MYEKQKNRLNLICIDILEYKLFGDELNCIGFFLYLLNANKG